MEIATVTSKGQITIPVSIRKLLGLEKGTKVILEEEDGKVVMVNASARHLDLSRLVFASQPVSTAEAFSDEEPFDWKEDIINGERKIEI